MYFTENQYVNLHRKSNTNQKTNIRYRYTMSGFVPAHIETPVPYCTLVSGTKYRIQYHNVNAPHSGKAIGTFEKLMIDFDPTEDEDVEDAELAPMDTIGYAIFKDVHPVHGAKKSTGMDDFRTDGHKYAFPVFSQEGDQENVVANDEVSFYAYTLPEHQSRMFHRVLSRRANSDVAKGYKSFFGGKRMITKIKRRSQSTLKCRGGKKPRVVKKTQRRYVRRDQGQPYQGPPPPYVDPMAQPPRQGALSWGDAAKLAAANAAGAVVAVVGEESFEDV